MLKILRTVFPPIHPAGWPFIAAFAVLDVALWVAEDWLGWLGLILVAWCVYFFRNPDRVTPVREGLVVSPADGFVQSVEPHLPPSELGMAAQPLTRISVFMNIFDVHVNRVPVDATVVATSYRPGRFFNASLDKASELNERQSIRLRVADGRELALVQIAGLVARRISCRLDQGQPARVGERFGLIRFGSRVDVYLPEGVAPLVIAGQRATAGETVLADLASAEAPRVGEMR